MNPLKTLCARLVAFLCAAACLGAMVAAPAHGALTLTPVLSGLSSPLYLTNARDGSNRIFIVEQPGRIKVLAPGATTPTTYLDIVSKVLSSDTEQGLLGLAFHPQFAANSRFFVNYTRKPDGATVVAEYRAFADPVATAASESVILVIAQPQPNHNGGMMDFGNDGFLYIGTGDGGGGNDPQNRAQNKDDLLGKILRIDIDNPAGGNLYSSPAGNPYLGATPGRDEIYALGMRNPYRFSFDRQTGQLYVGDVGQGALEEIDLVTAGGNYGWRVYEGGTCTGLDPGLCNPNNFVPPITQFDHTAGRCSVIGGYVYRGTASTLALGTYVFADFCGGQIYSLVGGAPNLLIDTAFSISSFGEDEAREIYIVSLGGTVHRLTNSASTTTTLASSPNPAAFGAAVTFTATVTGNNPTGTVTFVADSGPAMQGCSAVAFSGGSGNTRTATCTVSTLAAGTHTIVATYSGDAGNLSSSNASPLSQVITGGGSSGASATFVRTDVTTHGNWKGVYGTEGYAVFGDTTNYPAYAQVTATGKGDFTWSANPDAETRATQRAANGRIAACWYGTGSSFNVDVNLTDSATHRVAMYFLDWDTSSRMTRVDVLDAGTQQVLATQTVSAYHDGAYLVFDLKGHVILRVTNVAGANAVLSALFFDSPGGAPVTFAVSGTVSVGATPLAGVHFAAPSGGSCPDSDSSGNYTCTVPSGWSGTVTPSLTNYSFAPTSRSYSNVVANQSGQNYAATAVTPTGPSATFVRTDVTTHGNWKGVYGTEGYAVFGDTTNYPAYAQVTATGKGDFTWSANPDAETRATQRAANGRIAACWYGTGSSFNVDVNLTDSATHRVAMYFLDWDTSSRMTRVDVLDAGTQQVLATQTVSAYHDGAYLVFDLKGHVILRVTNVAGANAVLSALFFDSPGGAPVTFAVSGTVSVGATPLAGVHFAAPSGGSCPDSDSSGNYTCTVPSGWSGTVTPSLTNYSFAPTSRSYSNVVANQSGQNYAATAVTPTGPSATFVRTDVTTHGNWKGVYGTEGYAVFGDTTNYPAYAQVTATGKGDFTWSANPDAETRATQRAANGRIAACWYGTGSSFNVDVNLTDSATHRVAMYFLDWDTSSRMTRVDVLDAGTQQVLATQTVSAYHDGAYLVFDLKGHVILRVTNVAGANAVLSALFFDSPGGAGGGAVAWSTFGRDAQHTAQSTTASQALNQIHWQTPVDLQPQYSGGGSLLVHYGSPLMTAANTVIVPVKTGATGGFRVEARAGSTGALQWSMTTDYILPAANWVPSYGPALSSQARLYFPGAGGRVYFRDQADATSGASGQVVFYGLANYQANPSAYDASVIINTPLTIDPSGNLYFGFLVTGSTPLGLTNGIARISANGQGTWTPVTTASADASMTRVPHNSAPALSTDHQTLYVAVSNGSSGYLVALNATTLAPLARVALVDPKSGQAGLLSDNGSSSPTVGTDGDVYFGVLDNPFGSNHRRGWLLHFNANLSQVKTPGAFGWDTTIGLVPAQMVPSYQGTSTYLLSTKYNHYLGLGGDGMNKIAILDPNATQVDPVTGTSVMKEVLTILGPTPDPSGGVKEWCINTAAVDPATKSILANNEDGKLYRWDLTTNTLSQVVVLTAGIGEAYTSTVIGPDGKVYATNNATLFAVGQ